MTKRRAFWKASQTKSIVLFPLPLKSTTSVASWSFPVNPKIKAKEHLPNSRMELRPTRRLRTRRTRCTSPYRSPMSPVGRILLRMANPWPRWLSVNTFSGSFITCPGKTTHLRTAVCSRSARRRRISLQTIPSPPNLSPAPLKYP